MIHKGYIREIRLWSPILETCVILYFLTSFRQMIMEKGMTGIHIWAGFNQTDKAESVAYKETRLLVEKEFPEEEEDEEYNPALDVVSIKYFVSSCQYYRF